MRTFILTLSKLTGFYWIGSVKALDRHLVSVTCVDRGSPSLTSTASLQVLVDDVNDNPPRLDRQHYVFRVAENARRSTDIGRIAAQDRDLGPSGSVSFQLKPRDPDNSESMDAIRVDPVRGVVTVEAGM